MPKALKTRIVKHAGNEYRLMAGREAPEMPEGHVKALAKVGLLEKLPRPPKAETERKEE